MNLRIHTCILDGILSQCPDFPYLFSGFFFDSSGFFFDISSLFFGIGSFFFNVCKETFGFLFGFLGQIFGLCAQFHRSALFFGRFLDIFIDERGRNGEDNGQYNTGRRNNCPHFNCIDDFEDFLAAIDESLTLFIGIDRFIHCTANGQCFRRRFFISGHILLI